MKTITIDELKGIDSSLERIVSEYRFQQEWTALDILKLPESLVNNLDKLGLVLCEDLIDAPVLHEFACRCAERALSRIDNPDSRSVAAIAAKRAWLEDETKDEELSEASADVCDAAFFAGSVTDDVDAAYWAANAASWTIAWYAAYWSASYAAYCSADVAAERAWQVDVLIKILEEEE